MDILKELDDIHWDLVHLHNVMDDHPWSKRITRQDSYFVNSISKKMMKYSNRVFQVETELRGL